MDKSICNERKEIWQETNYAFLLNLFLMENPDVKQHEIAEKLGLAPISISRILKINKKRQNGEIKDSWIPVFEKSLMSLDLDSIEEEIIKLKQTKETIQNYTKAVFMKAERMGKMEELFKAMNDGPEEFDKFAATIGIDSIRMGGYDPYFIMLQNMSEYSRFNGANALIASVWEQKAQK